MKFSMLILAVFYVAFSFAQANNELSFPINYINGYGPFPPDYSIISFDSLPESHPFYKAYKAIKFKGIPANWKNLKIGRVFIDPEQWLYQNYRVGNISPEVYKQVTQEMQMDISHRNMTLDSIACIVLIAKGIDETGKEKLLVDYNNNGDFSDETAFVPQIVSSGKLLNSFIQYAKNLTYQTTKSSFKRIPFLVLKNEFGYIYSFAQYAFSNIKQNGKVYKIAVSHKFRNPAFWDLEAGIYLGIAFNKSELVRKGEFITIEKAKYNILGININKDLLLLKKQNENERDLQSSQIGFSAIEFSGKDILSEKAVALNRYKGKYVYMDFWGSWCGPCVGEIPQLKIIYDKVDSSKIDFIGVVGKDNIGEAKKAIIDLGIPWSNILSDSMNLIVEKYHNLKYPTGFLIDPDGKIVINDLNSYELEAKLEELKLLR